MRVLTDQSVKFIALQSFNLKKFVAIKKTINWVLSDVIFQPVWIWSWHWFDNKNFITGTKLTSSVILTSDRVLNTSFDILLW